MQGTQWWRLESLEVLICVAIRVLYWTMLVHGHIMAGVGKVKELHVSLDPISELVMPRGLAVVMGLAGLNICWLSGRVRGRRALSMVLFCTGSLTEGLFSGFVDAVPLVIMFPILFNAFLEIIRAGNDKPQLFVLQQGRTRCLGRLWMG